jgi:tetratricopeptide (TPR) repeat protein
LSPEQAAIYSALREAGTPGEADRIAEQVLGLLVRSSSATVNVLMDRAALAEAHGEPTRARLLLDEAIALEPGFAEAYGRRAALAFAQDDFAGALQDLQAAVAREPRHFAALAGLGAVYEALNRPDEALKAYRAALEVHPFFEQARQGVARTARQVEGVET